MPDVSKNVIKGGMFRAYLIGRLLLEQKFSVAVPEPDLGDDLWVRRIESGGAVYRAQLKASFKPIAFHGMNRYTINDGAESFAGRLHTPFIYFFGLYSQKAQTFRVGCIPIRFFRPFWRRDAIRIADKKRPRVMLEFLENESTRQVFFHWKEQVDVTRFFDSFAALK